MKREWEQLIPVSVPGTISFRRGVHLTTRANCPYQDHSRGRQNAFGMSFLFKILLIRSLREIFFVVDFGPVFPVPDEEFLSFFISRQYTVPNFLYKWQLDSSLPSFAQGYGRARRWNDKKGKYTKKLRKHVPAGFAMSPSILNPCPRCRADTRTAPYLRTRAPRNACV